jgi:hypothetical protein
MKPDGWLVSAREQMFRALEREEANYAQLLCGDLADLVMAVIWNRKAEGGRLLCASELAFVFHRPLSLMARLLRSLESYGLLSAKDGRRGNWVREYDLTLEGKQEFAWRHHLQLIQ